MIRIRITIMARIVANLTHKRGITKDVGGWAARISTSLKFIVSRAKYSRKS